MLQRLQECNVQGADQEYAFGFPVEGKERCLETQTFWMPGMDVVEEAAAREGEDRGMRPRGHQPGVRIGPEY